MLFYLLYLNNFYGEAVSGPLPFAAEMTGKTFRDFVQAHLSWWFVESTFRVQAIESNFFVLIFGERLGTKLKYAVQKATYDISVDPYDTNTLSDIYVILTDVEIGQQ